MSTALEVLAGEEYLASGEWVQGASLQRHMGDKITPGRAERYARDNMRRPDDYSRDKLIEMGRKNITRERISYRLSVGIWESDPDPISRSHWLGFETWRIRAKHPGSLGIGEMCEHLNKVRPDLELNGGKLTKWIADGWVPRPLKPTGTVWLIPKNLIPVYERVAVAAPTRGARWTVEPSALWRNRDAERRCPHCQGLLEVVTEIRAVEDFLASAEGDMGVSEEEPEPVGMEDEEYPG